MTRNDCKPFLALHIIAIESRSIRQAEKSIAFIIIDLHLASKIC